MALSSSSARIIRGTGNNVYNRFVMNCLGLCVLFRLSAVLLQFILVLFARVNDYEGSE